jgi:hypothetical protein
MSDIQIQVFRMLNHVHDNRIVLPYYCHLSNIWLIENFGFSLQYGRVSGEPRSFIHWCDENCYSRHVLII